jgi:hypothetical protein
MDEPGPLLRGDWPGLPVSGVGLYIAAGCGLKSYQATCSACWSMLGQESAYREQLLCGCGGPRKLSWVCNARRGFLAWRVAGLRFLAGQPLPRRKGIQLFMLLPSAMLARPCKLVEPAVAARPRTAQRPRVLGTLQDLKSAFLRITRSATSRTPAHTRLLRTKAPPPQSITYYCLVPKGPAHRRPVLCKRDRHKKYHTERSRVRKQATARARVVYCAAPLSRPLRPPPIPSCCVAPPRGWYQLRG